MEIEKNFKGWASEKEKIHHDIKESKIYFHQQEIWWSQCGVNIGSEQDGKGDEFSRPVLILKKMSRHMFWAVPISTKIKEHNQYYISYINASGELRSAIFIQIRLMSSKRLLRKLEYMPDDAFLRIKKAIKDYL